MAKKLGFTLEQHEKLGLELQTMRDSLVKITVEIGKAYPNKIAEIASKASDIIDSLRSALDDKVCIENRDLKDASRIYYRANRSDYKQQE